MDGKLPVRKRLRLEHYDYSSAGAYFVTICIQDRKRVLSEIVAPAYAGDGALDVPPGGDKQYVEDGTKLHEENVPQIRLKSMGKIIEKHLLSSEKIQGVTIDQYVIMPDHIHVIIFLDPEKYTKAEGGTSRRRPLRMKCCRISFPRLKGFVIRRLAGMFFNAPMMSA